MKMYSIRIVSKKAYKGVHKPIFRALVMANNKEEALQKANEKYKLNFPDSITNVYEVEDGIYTY